MSKNAIISVSNKTNLDKISNFLLENGFTIFSTGGTFSYIVEHSTSAEHITRVKQISDYTGFPEILDGRVKTLHPKIYGGLLCNLDLESHVDESNKHDINIFSVVIVNLYPFQQNNTIENIDIGGVSLIRAASKNYKHVSILTNPELYDDFMDKYSLNGGITIDMRHNYARLGFQHTSNYDTCIYNYFNNTKQISIPLKYGANPHQTPSNITIDCIDGVEPFSIINGTLGYINVMDFVHGWLTVYEIHKATNQIAFISMKHTSPAGLGISTPLNPNTLDIFGVSEDLRAELSPCSWAFIKSRNCDPLSSFGDFICCSSLVDTITAQLIKREVCDGIAAPDFSDEALEILKSKKGGKFIIIKMNINYCEMLLERGWQETKSIYGITLNQPYNNFEFNTINLGFEHDDYDAIISYYVLKYAQSNNVSMVYDGQLLGLGCGQQNRVNCVKLAGGKSHIWRMRHHKKTIEFYNSLPENMKRQEKVNSVYEYINENNIELITSLEDISITMGSDGFFPFPDNIVEANNYGVKRILQPGGSIMDESVLNECNKYNIKMYNIGTRMFYH